MRDKNAAKGGIAVGEVGSINGTHMPLHMCVPDCNPHAFEMKKQGAAPTTGPMPQSAAKFKKAKGKTDGTRRKRNPRG